MSALAPGALPSPAWRNALDAIGGCTSRFRASLFMTRSQLQRLLASAGLSQRGATRAIGISDRTMRKYIRDDLPIPRVVEYALYFVIRELEAGPHGGITGQFDRAGAEIDNDKREGGWRL
jgi:hypothetical protein